MNKKQRIDYFKKRVKYYFYDFFKMVDYDLSIKKQIKNGARSSTYWHSMEDGSGMILICYSVSWMKSKINKKEIDKVAFHETWEAILWELQELCKSRFISEKDIPNAVHRVIKYYLSVSKKSI